MNLLIALTSKLFGGPFKWLFQWVIASIFGFIWKWAREAFEEHKRQAARKKEIERKLREYEEAIKNNASREERRAREEDIINTPND